MMADKTAGSDGNEIDVNDIIAAGLGHTDALSTEDLAEFDHLFETSDLSQEERLEFLQNMWNIIVSLIDFAHGDHPIQLALKGSGKITKIDYESGITDDNMVQSGHNNLTEKYNKAAE